MRAKEKAFRIFGLMRTEIALLHDSEILKDKIAKNLSLIAVDEIIKECWDHREIDLQAGYDYWVSVKQETEKL